MEQLDWYTVDKTVENRPRGNNIVDAVEREQHAEAEMQKAKEQTEKYNKCIGSMLETETVNCPQYFVSPDCKKTSNPDFKYNSNYVEKFHVGEIVK